MKKVLVTGATGFIGNLVISQLLKQGYAIVASSSSKDKAARFDWYPHVTYLALDLKVLDDSVDYYSFFKEPDILIHLAWEGLPNYKSLFHIEDNLPRHLLFLNNMIRNGLKDLTIAGTCLEYGMMEGCLHEEMPVSPITPYAIAKNLLRFEVEKICKGKHVHLKWVRLFYMFGKGQNPNSLFAQLDKAIEEGQSIFNMSGGEQERDFMPVEKMVNCVVSIAVQQEVEGVINCCSGQPIKVKKLVQNILSDRHSMMKLNLGFYPYADYEPMSFWGNDSKLNKIMIS
jgi:nucleoside-diphosphate-sugar epimerase